VQKVMGYLCASLTLEEAAATFSRILPLAMSGRQALSLIQPLGERLAEPEDDQVSRLWQEAEQARSAQKPAPTSEAEQAIDRMYIEMDGVNARVRRGSVAMQEKEQQRSGDVYREVKVGAIFTAARGPRRSSLVPGVFVDEADEQSYVARRCPAEDFGKLLFAQASECGLAHAEQVVVLSDGAVWIRHLVTEHLPGALHIVDLWHARQHVWDVAHAVFGRATPQGVSWATQACDLLEQGQIEELVTAIRALPPIAPEPDASRSVPEIEADYFTINACRMRYPGFRAQGLQVGSGIAEAAGKTVVSTRAKRSGMRWTPAGLDAVLALRIAVLNGAYDAFWEDQYGLVA
jgi:hypothetical protein